MCVGVCVGVGACVCVCTSAATLDFTKKSIKISRKKVSRLLEKSIKKV